MLMLHGISLQVGQWGIDRDGHYHSISLYVYREGEYSERGQTLSPLLRLVTPLAVVSDHSLKPLSLSLRLGTASLKTKKENPLNNVLCFSL